MDSGMRAPALSTVHAEGNLWPLVLLALAVSPSLCRPGHGRVHEPNRP